MSSTNPTWETIVTDVTAIIGAIGPVLDVASPAVGAAITVASKVIAGVAAAEPTAVALYDQITSGTLPTAADLQAFAASYEGAWQKLNADIAVQLTTTST